MRPEYLQISREAGTGTVPGEVYTRQILGTDVLYEIRAGDTLLRSVRPIVDVFAEGDEVEVGIDWQHAFVFDPGSEEWVYPS